MAALCGIFTGIRGGLFTLTMARLNIRLRKKLFRALVQVEFQLVVFQPNLIYPVQPPLQMEMGFFDKSKTGEWNERLKNALYLIFPCLCRGHFIPAFFRYKFRLRPGVKLIDCSNARRRSELISTSNLFLTPPQISLNINVLARSATQALLVLVFMIYASWRLTTITFILIPLVMAISSVSAWLRSREGGGDNAKECPSLKA